MELKDYAARRGEAARAFEEHEGRRDGTQVVNSLSDGLTTLRSLLFTRIHEDVESKIGRDSMLIPLSPDQGELAARLEIEWFALAESVVQVQARRYVDDAAWYAQWLAALRLGDDRENAQAKRRIERYLAEDPDRRRLSFTGHLERAYPQARRAPLVLYRLFPLSVGIATALAFRCPLDANELRNRQMTWLPAIQDCHECHGAPLENGEKCRLCGNPVWRYAWLTAAD